MDCHRQPAPQFAETDQQQAQAVLGIHVEAGEQAQILKDVVAEVLGLVDDQHRQLLGLLGQARELGANGAVGGGTRAFGRQAKLPGDDLVGVEDAAGGQ